MLIPDKKNPTLASLVIFDVEDGAYIEDCLRYGRCYTALHERRNYKCY